MTTTPLPVTASDSLTAFDVRIEDRNRQIHIVRVLAPDARYARGLAIRETTRTALWHYLELTVLDVRVSPTILR